MHGVGALVGGVKKHEHTTNILYTPLLGLIYKMDRERTYKISWVVMASTHYSNPATYLTKSFNTYFFDQFSDQ